MDEDGELCTGARLDRLNRIVLYDRMVDDLGLAEGDMVFFVPNEDTGRWEVHTESEVMQEMKDAWGQDQPHSTEVNR